MTYFIIGLLLVSVGSVLIFNSCGKDGNRLGIAYIGLMLCIVGMACLLHNNPQAIDVYRGKTILCNFAVLKLRNKIINNLK